MFKFVVSNLFLTTEKFFKLSISVLKLLLKFINPYILESNNQ